MQVCLLLLSASSWIALLYCASAPATGYASCPHPCFDVHTSSCHLHNLNHYTELSAHVCYLLLFLLRRLLYLRARCVMLASVKPVLMTSEQHTQWHHCQQYNWSGACGPGASVIVNSMERVQVIMERLRKVCRGLDVKMLFLTWCISLESQGQCRSSCNLAAHLYLRFTCTG